MVSPTQYLKDIDKHEGTPNQTLYNDFNTWMKQN